MLLLVLEYVQVIPAFEEAVSGMALGGIRRYFMLLKNSKRSYYPSLLS